MRERILEAIKRVDEEIDRSNKGESIYSVNMLYNIKKELKNMYSVMDNSKYKPSYGRPLLDYPETELANYLFEISYFYEKIKH